MIDRIIPYQHYSLPEIIVSYSCHVPITDRIQITTSYDAMKVCRSIFDASTIEYQEHFYAIYLTRSNTILGYHKHSIGGLTSTIVDTRQILAIALKANASSIILCHNHPSGNPKPSKQDTYLTKRIASAVKALDVTLLDHLILTKEDYYSFVDEGTLPAYKPKELMAVTEN